MKVNANIRIGNTWKSVRVEAKTLDKWFDFAFEKWGVWGLENTETQIVEGVAVGNWKEIEKLEEI